MPNLLSLASPFPAGLRASLAVVLGLGLGLASVAAPGAGQPAAPSASHPFDGEWLVTMTCPNNTEKSAARGYRRQFRAQVKDDLLRGEIGTAGAPGHLRIEGPIAADGSALLDAIGRTGDADYAVNHPPPSSPYAYHVQASFDGSRGTGKRLEQRVCSFAFERK
ncbi:MAG: hypothetical protein ABI364_07425 [Caldimonas sp.]